MKHSSCLPVLLVCAVGSQVFAQAEAPTPALDPTTINADADKDRLINPELSLGGKLPFSIFETPRAVETVTREQFTSRGAQNLEEAGRYVSGVQTGYYGLDTRQDFIRIRGLNSLNYRDGLQHNFNFYNNAAQEAYSIEQIDFIKGPASILFGRGTVGGTTNTTSKTAGPDAKNEIMAGYGTNDRFQLGLDYNMALNAEKTLFFRMVGYYRDSDRDVDHVMDNSKFLMPSLTWKPNDQTSLSMLLNFQENHSKPSLQFYPYEATQIPGKKLSNDMYGGEPSLDRYDSEQTGVSVIFNHEFNETYSISSTLRYVQSSAEYVDHTMLPPVIGDNFIAPLPAGYYHRILYASDDETNVLSGNVVLNAKFDTGPVKHDLRFGMDYTHSERDRDTLPSNPGLFGLPYAYGGFIDLYNPTYGVNAATIPALSSNLKTTENMVGLFIHDQIKWDRLIVSGGLRYDDYSMKSNQLPTDNQNNWAFDAGIMYQFDHGISPYYSYAESFEPQGINTTTNKAFKPKLGSQHEVGIKWMPTDDTLIVASYFSIEESNRVIGSGLSTTQSSSVEVEGAELSIRHRIRDFDFLASYTHLDTSNNDLNGSPALTGVPNHQAQAWVTYRPEEGPLANFTTGLGIRYNGSTSDGYDMINTDSHTLVDAMVSYRWENVKLQLNVSNLFDTDYIQTQETTKNFGTSYISTFLGQGRSVNLSATFEF